MLWRAPPRAERTLREDEDAVSALGEKSGRVTVCESNRRAAMGAMN
jgi:hypothetical protein